jgi:hypothetical protein
MLSRTWSEVPPGRTAYALLVARPSLGDGVPLEDLRLSVEPYGVPGSQGPSAMSWRSAAWVSEMSSLYVSVTRSTEITVMSAIAAM